MTEEVTKLSWGGGDGSKYGLSDWYERLEKAIQEALDKGPDFSWTTGWYSSKKEIASGRITHAEGKITCEASCSDDFDTEGGGDVEIPHTTDIDLLRKAMDEAYQQADDNINDNAVYFGFSVHNEQGRWVETYIAPMGLGHEMDSPPGDNCSKWGWQGDSDIPKDVKDVLASWAEDPGHDRPRTHQGWTIRPWDYENDDAVTDEEAAEAYEDE